MLDKKTKISKILRITFDIIFVATVIGLMLSLIILWENEYEIYFFNIEPGKEVMKFAATIWWICITIIGYLGVSIIAVLIWVKIEKYEQKHLGSLSDEFNEIIGYFVMYNLAFGLFLLMITLTIFWIGTIGYIVLLGVTGYKTAIKLIEFNKKLKNPEYRELHEKKKEIYELINTIMSEKEIDGEGKLTELHNRVVELDIKIKNYE